MVKHWLQQMLGRMFQPVSQNDALRIASQSLLNAGSGIRLICHDTKPARFRIYADLPEPCWWVEVQGGDGKEGYVLRSSRVIVIGRQTGTIHYDGSAGDEGITGTIVLLITPHHESA